MAAVAEYKRKKKVYGLGNMFTARTCAVCQKEFIIPDAGTSGYFKQAFTFEVICKYL